jgi:hypothetical protein
MRTFRAVSLAAIISWAVGVAIIGVEAFLGLVAEPGPHQLFAIAAIAIGLAVAAVGTAVVFGIVLWFGGRRTALRWSALVLVVLLLLVLSAPAIFGLITTDSTDVEAQAALASLTIFLGAVAVAAVAVILTQRWVVVRRLGLAKVTGEAV